MMHIRKLTARLLLAVLVTAASANAFGLNTFDGEVAALDSLPDDVFEPRTRNLRVGQLLIIEGLPHTSPLAEGIELTIQPPASIRGASSAFAVYVFKQVTPRSGQAGISEIASGDAGSFQGERIVFELLPARTPFSIRIPARDEHSIRGGIDSRVTSPIHAQEDPIAVAILPVMKGLPSEMLNAPFAVTTSVQLTGVGGLDFSVESHDGESLTAEDLSERAIQLKFERYGELDIDETMFIRPGIYQLLIERDGVLLEAAQVGVEQGKIKYTEVTLPRPESTLRFQVPDFIAITVNDEEISESSLVVSPGEYTVDVSFRSYRKRHELSVQAGREYIISVGLDVLVDSRKSDGLQDQQ